MSGRVQNSEIDKANNVHVLDYLTAKGEQFERQGSYFRLATHDSLVVRADGKWFWNSKGVGGFGAISLSRELYNHSFKDAVNDVNGQNIVKSQDYSINPNRAEAFHYPQQYEITGLNHARTYLSEERKLDHRTIDEMVDRGLLAEDKLKNCIFKWKNSNDELIGYEKQGTQPIETTRGYFKYIDPLGKEDAGFRFDVGTPNKLIVLEAPIDALSYYELKKPDNARILSMSGLKDRTLTQELRALAQERHLQGGTVEQVIFAVDNDKAGRAFFERWENLINIATPDFPKEKDWNIDLQKSKESTKAKTQTYELER